MMSAHSHALCQCYAIALPPKPGPAVWAVFTAAGAVLDMIHSHLLQLQGQCQRVLRFFVWKLGRQGSLQFLGDSKALGFAGYFTFLHVFRDPDSTALNRPCQGSVFC